jgi:hypothetical protein
LSHEVVIGLHAAKTDAGKFDYPGCGGRILVNTRLAVRV